MASSWQDFSEKEQDRTDSRENYGLSNDSSKTTKLCWYFVNQQYCRYGRNCRFRHPKLGSGKSYRNRVFTNSKFASAKHNHGERVNRDEHRSNVYVKVRQENSNMNSSIYGAAPDCTEPREFSSGLQKSTQGQHCHTRSEINNMCSSLEILNLRNSDSVTSCEVTDRQSEKTENCDIGADSCFMSGNPKTALPLERNMRYNPREPVKLDQLNTDGLARLRESEIKYLTKRYRCHEIESDSGCILQFSFSCSDPDWHFDVKAIALQVTFHESYPEVVCDVIVLDDEERMPSLLLRFLNKRIKDWLEERHEICFSSGKVELVMRPFLLWLDRNMEQLFIEGLRKVKVDQQAKNDGIEFVPFECLPGAESSHQEENQENVVHNSEIQNSESTVPKSSEYTDTCKENASEHESWSSNNSESEEPRKTISSDVISALKLINVMKNGTEIKLINLELRESAGALVCQKAALTMCCGRCKTYVEMMIADKQRCTVSCSKCHQILNATFQSIMLHPFSNVMGYLHQTDCQVIDLPLVQCNFLVDCLNCSRQSFTNGIHYGQSHVTWCTFCNNKLSIFVETVKFQHLQPPERSGRSFSYAKTRENSRKKSNEPVFKEGKPLPGSGTCRHYKKSHRWLRFPCCGKAYPCDVCHGENETGHEIKFASRMICGFCCKEQPYSKDKPCVSCSSSLTKKSGAHWEGGSGCRNHTKMSREDRQKYAGINKTLSRKAELQKQKK